MNSSILAKWPSLDSFVALVESQMQAVAARPLEQALESYNRPRRRLAAIPSCPTSIGFTTGFNRDLVAGTLEHLAILIVHGFTLKSPSR